MFLVDLQNLLSVCRIAAPEERATDEPIVVRGWVHWCHAGWDRLQAGGSGEEPRGNVCCQSFKESLAKVSKIVQTWCTGKLWAVAAESRWTHTMHLRRRWLMAAVANNSLANALIAVQTGWDLNISMVSLLEKQIDADKGNFSAKRKLKLLRVCNLLCGPNIAADIAVDMIGEMWIDLVLFKVLGSGKKYSRMTVLELCTPSLSPVCEAQQAFCELLTNFSSTNILWQLFTFVAGDFNDINVRVHARSHILKLDAGLVSYFCIRLSGPPHSLLCILFDQGEVSDEFVDARLADFYSKPEQCLSLMARNLRKRFSGQSFVQQALPELQEWAEKAFLSMDYVERSHNHMRTDLRSSGRAKNVRLSMDRILVRQAEGHHRSRGGRPCGKKLSWETIENLRDPAAMELCDQGANESDSGAAIGRDTPPTSQRVVPAAREPDEPLPRSQKRASAWLKFSNMKRRAFKALVAPHRKLTAEEIKSCEAAIQREWKLVAANDEDFGKFETLAIADQLKTNSQLMVKHQVEVARSQAFCPLWGGNQSADFVFDPVAVAAFNNLDGQEETNHERNDECFVQDSVPSRCSKTIKTSLSIVHGCHCAKKNVCRLHGLELFDVQKLDRFTYVLKQYVSTLSKASLNDCMVFFYCETICGTKQSLHYVQYYLFSALTTLFAYRIMFCSPRCSICFVMCLVRHRMALFILNFLKCHSRSLGILHVLGWETRMWLLTHLPAMSSAGNYYSSELIGASALCSVSCRKMNRTCWWWMSWLWASHLSQKSRVVLEKLSRGCLNIVYWGWAILWRMPMLRLVTAMEVWLLVALELLARLMASRESRV